MGRGLTQPISLIEDHEKKGIHFKSLTDNIDTHTTAGRFFFRVMGNLAEMERNLIVERTRAGLRAAKLAARDNPNPEVITALMKAGGSQRLKIPTTKWPLITLKTTKILRALMLTGS